MSAASATATPNTAVTYNPASETERRLNALLAQNAEYARHKALYRTYQEEIDALSMRTPLTAQQAYGYLGLFLGAFPPAAYFTRMGYGFGPGENVLTVGLFIFMNAVCALVGWKMGKVFGGHVQKAERASWNNMILGVSLLALCWAIVTGFAGGAIFFIIGGVFGAVFATPVALAGFIMFAIVHRLLERGSLVEKAQALPLAFGISLTIAAFILGVYK